MWYIIGVYDIMYCYKYDRHHHGYCRSSHGTFPQWAIASICVYEHTYIQYVISLPSSHVYRPFEWCCQSLMLCAWNARHLLFLGGQFYHLEEIHEKGQCA